MYCSWDSNILSSFLMILTPKTTLALSMSFISNLDPRKNLVQETISMHAPKINMSSINKCIMTQSSFFNLECTHLKEIYYIDLSRTFKGNICSKNLTFFVSITILCSITSLLRTRNL